MDIYTIEDIAKNPSNSWGEEKIKLLADEALSLHSELAQIKAERDELIDDIVSFEQKLEAILNDMVDQLEAERDRLRKDYDNLIELLVETRSL
jgi:uncharacterized coiled-coil DUF342 family protein